MRLVAQFHILNLLLALFLPEVVVIIPPNGINDGPMYEVQPLDKLVPNGYRMIAVPNLRDLDSGIDGKAFAVSENEVCEIQTIAEPFQIMYRIRRPIEEYAPATPWNYIDPSTLFIQNSQLVEPVLCLWDTLDSSSSKSKSKKLLMIVRFQPSHKSYFIEVQEEENETPAEWSLVEKAYPFNVLNEYGLLSYDFETNLLYLYEHDGRLQKVDGLETLVTDVHRGVIDIRSRTTLLDTMPARAHRYWSDFRVLNKQWYYVYHGYIYRMNPESGVTERLLKLPIRPSESQEMDRFSYVLLPKLPTNTTEISTTIVSSNSTKLYGNSSATAVATTPEVYKPATMVSVHEQDMVKKRYEIAKYVLIVGFVLTFYFSCIVCLDSICKRHTFSNRVYCH